MGGNQKIKENREVQIEVDSVKLEGNVFLPEGAQGIVVFVHGSGSSRFSSRNQYVAGELQSAGLGTLLFDLLTADEEVEDRVTRRLRFDIEMLARRTVGAADWLSGQSYGKNLKFGFFGSSTGAAAGLIAAAERPQLAGAVVSRGGRPDLAAEALPRVKAPTLLIVGGLDYPVIELNEQALARMNPQPVKKLEIVEGATHLFEEPGTLKKAAHLARDWFELYLAPSWQE